MSPQVKKLLAIAAAVVYGVSPLDFIPDIVPPFTWVDDLGVLILALRYKPE